MPIYISRGRFTSDAIKRMLAKPENREEAVAKLFKSVGGQLGVRPPPSQSGADACPRGSRKVSMRSLGGDEPQIRR